MEFVKSLAAVVLLFVCVASADTSTVSEQPQYPILPDASGVVAPSYQTAIPKDADPKVESMLEQYRTPLKPFKWGKKFYHMQGDLPVYEVTFPSPVTTPTVENNTVHCEYFPALTGSGKRPTIIVLHVLGGQFAASRAVCGIMCRQGYNALMVKLPYYGPRRPAGTPEFMDRINDPYELGPVIRQAVMDVRRARDWLKTQDNVDPKRIGLVGMSLGGFTAALVSGVDATFKRVAIVVAGGNFAKVLTNPGAPIPHYIAICRNKGVTEDDLRKALVSNEPLTFAGRLKDTQVFMINGRQDAVVPCECADDFGKLANAYQMWYTGGHTALVPLMKTFIGYLGRHFSGDDWSQPSYFFKKKAHAKTLELNLQKGSAASGQSAQRPRG